MLEVIKHSARFDASPFMGVNGSKARTIKELYGLYCWPVNGSILFDGKDSYVKRYGEVFR